MKKYVMSFSLFVVALLLIGGCAQKVEDKLASAEKYLKTGKYSEAKEKVDEIVEADSTSPEAIYGVALLEQYRGLDWDALIKYIDASPMRNGYLPAMEAFTRLAIRLDYLPNARKMANLQIRRQPENPVPLFYLTAVDIREGKLDSARIHLHQAAQLTEDSLQVVLYEAEIDFHTYDPQTIQAGLRKIAQARFETANHFIHLAGLFRYLNMGDSAIHYMRQAVERDGDDVGLKLQLAQYLFDELYLAEATEIINEILSHSEAYGPAHVLAAYIEWQRGWGTRAEWHFYSYAELGRQRPIVGDKHGDMYWFFNEFRLAQIEWQAAYTLAANLAYPDDYLRQLLIKLINSFLEDHSVAMIKDYLQEGGFLLAGLPEFDLFRAEAMAQYEDVTDSARILVDDRLTKHWNDRRWLELVGAYYYRFRKYDQASDVYWRLLELPYPRLEFYLQLASIFSLQKDAEGMEKLIAAIPTRFEGNRRLLESLADFYVGIGRPDRALEYAERLYRQSSGYMPFVLTLVDLYTDMGRPGEVRGLLDRFAEQYPDDPESFYRLAKYEYYRGSKESVLENLNHSLALDTGYAFSMEMKGIVFQDAGIVDSAMYYYRQAIERHWPVPDAYLNLSEIYYTRGDSLDKAAGLAMAAINCGENDGPAYMLLGKIYYAQEKYKLARTQFISGNLLHPDDPEFLFRLGKAYIKMDDFTEARKSLRRALELNLASPLKEEAEQLLTQF